MREVRVVVGLQLGDDLERQLLAQLDAPLVERSDDQIAPWVNTLCSYSATSWPSTYGVSFSIRNVDDGWLPSNTLNGTRFSAVPSARTWSAVLPNASASPCAKTLEVR